MMVVTGQTLHYASQQLNIYGGLFMLIFGFVGACWSILIFCHHSIRSSSYCTYMLTMSIACIIEILFSLTNQIIDHGLNIHWTAYNASWCKIRYYIAHCAALIALSCLLCSAIDRFFTTCQIKWRRLNSAYVAGQVCLFVLIFWMLVTIPSLIFAQPIQTEIGRISCTISKFIWLQINKYFLHLVCLCIFPWFFMCLFGCLTMKNIDLIRNRRIGTMPIVTLSRMAQTDRQLASMLRLQIIVCAVSSIPFGVQIVYDSVTHMTPKDEYRREQEYLALQISQLVFQLNFVSLFYINYSSSKLFRQLSKQVLINLFKRRNDVSREITIVNHQDLSNNIDKRAMRPVSNHRGVSVSYA